MKRVIDGQTYNTDTSTVVARYEYTDTNDYETEATVYQTRGGAFFVVHEWEVDERAKVYFEAMSRLEVDRLVEKTDNLTIVDDSILAEPPEAAEEEEASATLYVRIPKTLKNRIDSAAKAVSLSANAWAMQCMERCLTPKDAA